MQHVLHCTSRSGLLQSSVLLAILAAYSRAAIHETVPHGPAVKQYMRIVAMRCVPA